MHPTGIYAYLVLPCIYTGDHVSKHLGVPDIEKTHYNMRSYATLHDMGDKYAGV